MNIIERISAYIQKTKMGNLDRYEMDMDELLFLKRECNRGDSIDALILAFDYGRAKGYRAARRASK